MKYLTQLYQLSRRFPSIIHFARIVGNMNISYDRPCVRDYCTNSTPNFRPHASDRQTELPWGGSSKMILLERLELALNGGCLDGTWVAFRSFVKLHGFPKSQLLSRIITLMSYSSDPHWLHKAYRLVLSVQKDKPHLLHNEPLTNLALTLVRRKKAIPASSVLRIIIERGYYPPADILNTLFFHLVKTQNGSYMASEILIELCECFLHPACTKGLKQMKGACPDITTFNIVLDSCARYKSTIKAHQIICLMPKVGVVADVNSIVMMARIYEMLGQRDELLKMRVHVDRVFSVTLNRHYQLFYNCLLSLHFKYNDLDAAAELALYLYKRSTSIDCNLVKASSGLQKMSMVQIRSSNLRMGCKVMAEPNQIDGNFVVNAESNLGLVVFMDGKLIPSRKTLSKIIAGYVRERKMAKLSLFLISIQKEIDPERAGLTSDVIEACVQLGWLETAHDILDDLESAEIPVGANVYQSLLKAYCKQNMRKELEVLLKQMKKIGHFVNFSDEDIISQCLLEDGPVLFDSSNTAITARSNFAEALDKEITANDLKGNLVHESNSAILFFCRAGMIDDALKTFQRMQQLGILPTIETFSYLVNCYSSLKMYRHITVLWGDIRRRMEDGVLIVNRDLLECLLFNLLKGGYFERVMEIINYMNRNKMYGDWWKCRREFLKFHKDLYRNLKASCTKTDAQSKRLEHVRAFRRWAGIVE